MFEKVAGLPRFVKIMMMLLCDVVLLPLAFWSSVALRLGTFQPDVSAFYWLFLIIPVVTVPIFVRIGLYRAVIRYLDDKIIYTVVYGVTLSVLLLMAAVVMGRATSVPRSSILIYWIIAVAYITTSRFLARGLLRSLERFEDFRQPVAIYGAGRAGMQTALALMSGAEYRPVAFFDDSSQLQGRSVAGIRVHSPDKVIEVLQQERCRQVLLAMPSASRTRRREIIQRFEGMEITLKTLPGMGELVDGRVRVEDIREVGVEDLLGRDPVPPFADLISSCIMGRSVLVTGAGGSIGSELCRQIVLNSPQKLILFEQSEYALYKIEQDLKRYRSNISIVPVLGNVLDQPVLERVLHAHSVNTVYHAAAYKHVPLVESNISAGVMNNVIGTMCAAQASINQGVENFVLISTDKAVRPTNIMGASKRMAELVLQALAKEGAQRTRFTMVRFGNVLGSSGSVVPLFKEQIKAGGPVTVTHPEVTRYFMTIPEAAQLVLQAGAMGQGGDVFVLDMGEPVKIADLAAKMIQLSGLEVRNPMTGAGDISIEFVGLRPGEKLYEELLIGDSVEKTRHPRIMRAVENMIEAKELFPKLSAVKDACEKQNDEFVHSVVRELVKEYSPSTNS
ncbi:nucleoside-diphosphate sugar epimerase/dehydratase [Bdellovibrio sp. NC01]|uniref:polysaccharide biosynthesis protein n=1 Tax=Bdellovibrio sp. NC01 TaxID=2220073 RepID=UPI001158C656|nr:nucleoside-diphosphate sugar epimerase/dehydratase [Bdellovibrio sp. NC01]QDK37518.1 polysaccharide biosynthesis protein [Bdellovibrio sp. NC01]